MELGSWQARGNAPRQFFDLGINPLGTRQHL
jgi:hypothetical protein